MNKNTEPIIHKLSEKVAKKKYKTLREKVVLNADFPNEIRKTFSPREK